MSSIVENISRVGNFTSSEIVALLSIGSRPMTDEEMEAYKKGNPKGKKKNIESWPGAAAVTYIMEKVMERRLGMSIDSDVDAKQLTWGCLGEKLVEMLLREYYHFSSDVSHVHPTIPYWSGARDALSMDLQTVAEVKCPYTRKSFCGLVDPLYDGLEGMEAMNAIRNGYTDKKGLFHAAHKDGEKFYQQIVSNSILADNCPNGELIVWMPYESELPAVQSAAETLLTQGEDKYYYIVSGKPKSLPYIKDNGFYQSLNSIKFEIPQSDKDLLTERVKQAGEYLK